MTNFFQNKIANLRHLNFAWVVAHQTELILLFIFLIALALRVQGLGFDLPNLYHPDEDAVLMPALSILKSGDWRPTRLEYGSFHIYLLTAVSAVVYTLLFRDGRIPGGITSLPIFERGTFPAVYQIPEFFIAARLVSAVLGSATVLLIYLLGVRLGGKRLGLLAAAITAVLPYHVADAHFATTDTPLFFWITLALYLMVRSYDNWAKDNVWAYVGAGFVAGLATATKYNGVLLLVPLMLIPLMRLKSLEDVVRLRPFSGGLAMAAGFMVGTPYAILDLPHFLSWFGYSLRLYNAPVLRALPAWQWHLNFHLSRPHAPIFVLGGIGFFISIYYWGKRGWLLNSFGLILCFAALNQTNYQARMWQPASMIVILWAALVIDLGLLWLAKKTQFSRWRHYLNYAPLLLLLPLAWISFGYGRNFKSGDVRTLATAWITENIPAGAAIAGDYFMPNVDPEIWPVTKSFHIVQNDIAWYQERDIQYLVLNEALNDFGGQPAELKQNYDILMNQVCLVGSVNGPFIATTNFAIKIYQLPPCET